MLKKTFAKEKTLVKEKNFSKAISESPWVNEVKTEFAHGFFWVLWPLWNFIGIGEDCMVNTIK